jgi:hypothetical protein
MGFLLRSDRRRLPEVSPFSEGENERPTKESDQYGGLQRPQRHGQREEAKRAKRNKEGQKELFAFFTLLALFASFRPFHKAFRKATRAGRKKCQTEK